jgi:hypothetical protein
VRRIACAVAAMLAITSGAGASWAVGASGTAATKAKTMLGGNVPNGSASGSSVTLTWTASLFADGSTIPSYAIRRFNALTSAEATVLSACSGIVTGTTCTENGVALGSWKYTVTPAAGAWRGAQSAQSAAILVTL